MIYLTLIEFSNTFYIPSLLLNNIFTILTVRYSNVKKEKPAYL